MPKEKPKYTVVDGGEVTTQALCFALFGKSVEQVANEIRSGAIKLEQEKMGLKSEK